MLGVPYGLIVGVAPKKAWVINCVEAGEAALSDLLEQGLITDDESDGIRTAMVEAGLESMIIIFDKIRRFPLPNEFLPLFNFEICNDANCQRPLTHGSIYDKDQNSRVTKNAISILTDGFEICSGLAQLGGNSTLEGIRLLQQILLADLPINKAEWYERYRKLPEETRCEYEEARGKAILKELFERFDHLEPIFTDN